MTEYLNASLIYSLECIHVYHILAKKVKKMSIIEKTIYIYITIYIYYLLKENNYKEENI